VLVGNEAVEVVEERLVAEGGGIDAQHLPAPLFTALLFPKHVYDSTQPHPKSATPLTTFLRHFSARTGGVA